MRPEQIEMGKSNPECGRKYESIVKTIDGQVTELRTLYRKVLMMRYEVAILGHTYLKTNKLLQMVKEGSTDLEEELDNDEGAAANVATLD